MCCILAELRILDAKWILMSATTTTKNLVKTLDNLLLVKPCMVRVRCSQLGNTFIEIRKRPGVSSVYRWAFLDPIIDEIRLDNCPRTIIFCKSMAACIMVYQHIRNELDMKAYTEQTLEFEKCLVQRYHSRTQEKVVSFLQERFVPNHSGCAALLMCLSPAAQRLWFPFPF